MVFYMVIWLYSKQYTNQLHDDDDVDDVDATQFIGNILKYTDVKGARIGFLATHRYIIERSNKLTILYGCSQKHSVLIQDV